MRKIAQTLQNFKFNVFQGFEMPATRIQNTSNSDYNPTSYHHTYNSIISYDCGLGKRFDKEGTFIRNVEYICDKRASGIHDIEVSHIRSPANQK